MVFLRCGSSHQFCIVYWFFKCVFQMYRFLCDVSPEYFDTKQLIHEQLLSETRYVEVNAHVFARMDTNKNPIGKKILARRRKSEIRAELRELLRNYNSKIKKMEGKCSLLMRHASSNLCTVVNCVKLIMNDTVTMPKKKSHVCCLVFFETHLSSHIFSRWCFVRREERSQTERKCSCDRYSNWYVIGIIFTLWLLPYFWKTYLLGSINFFQLLLSPLQHRRHSKQNLQPKKMIRTRIKHYNWLKLTLKFPLFGH